MLIDSFGRTIDYLRVSVTDHCDLHCQYCRPQGTRLSAEHGDLLTNAEIVCVVQAAALLGIRKVRLTGGEPLLRPGIIDLVRSLAAIPQLADLSLTSNGVRLADMAGDLARAGLRRVNVSLDTLRPDRFARLTGAAVHERVLQGISAARSAGLVPLKTNTVVMRGFNDDEICDFAALTMHEDWHVRFIEVMPLGAVGAEMLVPVQEILDRLPALVPAQGVAGHGPARIFRLPGARGTIAVIGPMTNHFCDGCNRLRLTADGRLRPCLLNDLEMDMRPALRSDPSTEALAQVIRRAVASKPGQHHLGDGDLPHGRSMAQIGG